MLFKFFKKLSKLAKEASSLWDFISQEKAKSSENIIHEICIYKIIRSID